MEDLCQETRILPTLETPGDIDLNGTGQSQGTSPLTLGTERTKDDQDIGGLRIRNDLYTIVCFKSPMRNSCRYISCVASC